MLPTSIKINIKGSYFLSEDPVQFDAPFFSMTANEANGTDPQQRLLLEVAYETLENGKISSMRLKPSYATADALPTQLAFRCIRSLAARQVFTSAASPRISRAWAEEIRVSIGYVLEKLISMPSSEHLLITGSGKRWRSFLCGDR